jgi:hypothetical protein
VASVQLASRSTSSRAGKWAVGALAYGVGIAHAWVYAGPFEDAFITYRYAEHLAHGEGLAYNPGEVVEGFTSFAWTLLLALASRLTLPIEATSRALSLGFALGILHVTTRIADEWGGLGARGGWVFAPALLVAAGGSWAFHAATGMETTLFVLLIQLALLYSTRDSQRSALAAALCLAASALVRPEGVGFFAVIAAGLAFDAEGRRVLPSMVAVFAGVYVPFFAWRWHHFGWPLPNTYYAKAQLSSALPARGLAYVESYFTEHLFWLALIAIFVLLGSTWRRPWRLALFVVTGAVVESVLVGGDAFLFHRLILPAIPAGAVAVAKVTADLSARRPWPLAWLAAGGFALLTAWAFAVEQLALPTLLTRRRESDRDLFLRIQKTNRDAFVIGEWLRSTFAPDATIAVNAAGIVPYVSGLRTIDMLGLNDVHIAHVPIQLGRGATGHEKHDAAYVLSRRPDVILFGLPELENHAPDDDERDFLVRDWFGFLAGDRELYEQPDFRRDYVSVVQKVAPYEYVLAFVRRGVNVGTAAPHTDLGTRPSAGGE